MRFMSSVPSHSHRVRFSSGTADEGNTFVDGLGARSGFGDDWLRIWGLKFVMDGGVAGAAASTS